MLRLARGAEMELLKSTFEIFVLLSAPSTNDIHIKPSLSRKRMREGSIQFRFRYFDGIRGFFPIMRRSLVWTAVHRGYHKARTTHHRTRRKILNYSTWNASKLKMFWYHWYIYHIKLGNLQMNRVAARHAFCYYRTEIGTSPFFLIKNRGISFLIHRYIVLEKQQTGYVFVRVKHRIPRSVILGPYWFTLGMIWILILPSKLQK
jgi:hypothetical protein